MTETGRCPQKIRWTFGTDAQCELDVHVTDVRVTPELYGQFSVEYVTLPGQRPAHQAKVGPSGATTLTWHPGDRREYTGDYPGPCRRTAGCTLHTGHHGRCAP